MQHFWYWLLPSLMVLTDLFIRGSIIIGFPEPERNLWVGSIFFSFLLYKLFDFILFKIKKRSPRWMLIAIGIISLLYTFHFAVTYGYYFANGLMPNFYTVDFIIAEPYNNWVIFRDFIQLYHILLLVGLYFFIVFIFHKNLSYEKRLLDWPWWGKIIHAGLLIFFSISINHNIRDHEQCYVADINNFGAIYRHIYNFAMGIESGTTGILARNPISLASENKSRPFNILLIVNESQRKQNLSLFGYQRQTTPFLDQFKLNHPEEVFLFERAYSNCTTTALSVPGIFTGISPIQQSHILHRVPLFWDYGKSIGYHTFFISSHTFNWYNFRLFFSSSAIDYLWNKEISGFQAMNDLGINDHLTITETLRHISLNKTTPFSGVVHLNTNHYPYIVENKYQQWSGNEIDPYDHTMLKHDDLMYRLFTGLDSLDVLRKTILISTSDHGEAFHEHGYIGHIFNHHIESISIPIWIYFPKDIQSLFNLEELRHNLQKNISNADLIPTILDFMEISQRPDLEPILPYLTGKSLLSAIESDRTILITNTNQIVRSNTGLSLIRGDWHYIMRINAVPVAEELYHLPSDPWEKNNRWDELSEKEKMSYRLPFTEYQATNVLYEQYIKKKINLSN